MSEWNDQSAFLGDQFVIEGNFHKDVFERISDEKRDSIFKSAMTEFASQGYMAANINTIASNAGISIGAMYTYFPSKENLFLALAEHGLGIFQRIVSELLHYGSFFETIERLCQLTIAYAKEHRELSQMYLELSTEQMTSISSRLNEKMEIDFQQFYLLLLNRALDRAEIRPDVDIGFASKMLDDCVVSLQLAFSVSYHEARLHQYVGPDVEEAEMIASTVDLIYRYLAPVAK